VLFVLLRSGAESIQTARVRSGDGWWTDTGTDMIRHDHKTRRPVLRVDLVRSRRIWPVHVGRLVDLDGSRRIPSDRLDDQTDDQASQPTPGGGGRVGHKIQRLELTPFSSFPIASAWASDCGSTAGSTAPRAGYLLTASATALSDTADRGAARGDGRRARIRKPNPILLAD